ncbi:hypothetical protein C8R46DRAFT_1191915 [Mycena filopes]|nr:hypothetical protein C8R46DRAFT_1191915 [Mycena filopes]
MSRYPKGIGDSGVGISYAHCPIVLKLQFQSVVWRSRRSKLGAKADQAFTLGPSLRVLNQGTQATIDLLSLSSHPLLTQIDTPMHSSSTFDLPNEMWFEIFKTLPILALRRVHSVSTLFHDISHPLFFRDFTLDPDEHDMAKAELIKRLGMYSSDSIAPHVRKLSVSFQFGRWFRTRSGGFITALSSATPLIAPLLRTMSHFHNLRTLECTFRFNSEVHFADLGLQDLPHLRDLRIEGGALFCPAQLPAKKIGVTHFSYTGIPSMSVHVRRDMRSFISMLDPETLSSLTLAPSYDSSPAVWLAYDHDLFTSFRQLRTVAIECDGPFLRSVHEFLVRLPALEELTLSGAYRSCTEFVPVMDGACLARGLRAFTGPCEYVPLFLPGTACAELTINALCAPDDLRCALKAASCTSSVRSLSLILPLAAFCGGPASPTLFDGELFPRLTALRLRVSDAADDDNPDACDVDMEFDEDALVDLPQRLAAVFRGAPNSLKEAVIEWDVDAETMSMLPALEDLRAAIVPHVRGKVVFEGGHGRMESESNTDTSESGSDGPSSDGVSC